MTKTQFAFNVMAFILCLPIIVLMTFLELVECLKGKRVDAKSK